MGKMSLIKEFWDFLKIRKRYWLVPIFVVFLLLGVLIFLGSNSAATPFIYALF